MNDAPLLVSTQAAADVVALIISAEAAVVVRDAVWGPVLVVRAGETHREAALRARRQLEAVGARLIGFVFNDATPDGQV